MTKHLDIGQLSLLMKLVADEAKKAKRSESKRGKYSDSLYATILYCTLEEMRMSLLEEQRMK